MERNSEFDKYGRKDKSISFSEKKVWPVDTVVRIKKTGEFALIKECVYLMEHKFLHYHGHIEGCVYKEHSYHALYHDELELECLPIGYVDTDNADSLICG